MHTKLVQKLVLLFTLPSQFKNQCCYSQRELIKLKQLHAFLRRRVSRTHSAALLHHFFSCICIILTYETSYPPIKVRGVIHSRKQIIESPWLCLWGTMQLLQKLVSFTIYASLLQKNWRHIQLEISTHFHVKTKYKSQYVRKSIMSRVHTINSAHGAKIQRPAIARC